jgi:hypothetical protein
VGSLCGKRPILGHLRGFGFGFLSHTPKTSKNHFFIFGHNVFGFGFWFFDFAYTLLFIFTKMCDIYVDDRAHIFHEFTTLDGS